MDVLLQGIARELRDDYGVEGTAVEPALLDGETVPDALGYADLLVTTEAHEPRVRALADQFGQPCIVASVRPDLVGGEWRLLLKRPVFVVVSDARFVETLRHFFAGTPGAENLRPLVVGRDDLAAIPDGAPTYVTRSAREALGDARIAGRVLPTARIFSATSARELVAFIVRANLDAIAARRRG